MAGPLAAYECLVANVSGSGLNVTHPESQCDTLTPDPISLVGAISLACSS